MNFHVKNYIPGNSIFFLTLDFGTQKKFQKIQINFELYKSENFEFLGLKKIPENSN